MILVCSFLYVCKMLAKPHNFIYSVLFQHVKKKHQNEAVREVPKFVRFVWEKVYTFLFPWANPYKKCNFCAIWRFTCLYMHIYCLLSDTYNGLQKGLSQQHTRIVEAVWGKVDSFGFLATHIDGKVNVYLQEVTERIDARKYNLTSNSYTWSNFVSILKNVKNRQKVSKKVNRNGVFILF